MVVVINGLLEEIYLNAFNHSLIGISFLTLDGRWFHINSAFCNIVGYTINELLNLTWQDITHPDDLSVGSEAAEKLMEGKIDKYQTEKRYIHKLGNIIWVQVCISLVRDKHGEPQYFLSQTQDITARKTEQEQLKKIEKLYHLIAENSQDIIYFSTPDSVCHYVSPAIKHLLGYEPNEIIGKLGLFLWHPDDLKQYLAIRELNVGVCTCRILHKKGHYIWFEIQLKTVRNEQNQTEFIVGIARDITKRKKTERLLEESENRHRSLLKYTPVGICAMDLTGKFIEVSPSYEMMTGYSSQELFSMTFRDVIHPQSLAWGEERFRKAPTGEIPDVEFALQHKNGSRIEVIASSSPIIINGETKGIYVITKDITNQKQTEELLLKAEKLSLIGELAAGIAHEIRNPLTSLRGFVQLFQSDNKANTKEYFYNLMLSEIDRINEIVSEMLVLAKPANEKIHLSSVSEKLDHVITLFEGQAHLFNIVINKDFDKNLPLIASQGSLKQVFINVLKNAIESMPNGGEIQVQARLMKDGICIRVIDQGCGIPEDILSKIGTPFYTTKEKGTGLGLMVSQRIIQNHEGAMRIKSKEGQGTTIEVFLPLGKKEC
jgi:two-component system, sporulation sensor kinase A